MKPVTIEDIDIAARTVYGEARGEGVSGMIAVAWVIRNRAEKGGWWGDTIAGVCKHPFQFSCWNPSDPNSKLIEALEVFSPPYRDSVWAVMRALMEKDKGKDPTFGSDHYHTPSVAPKWAASTRPMTVIGNHSFYKLP